MLSKSGEKVPEIAFVSGDGLNFWLVHGRGMFAPIVVAGL